MESKGWLDPNWVIFVLIFMEIDNSTYDSNFTYDAVCHARESVARKLQASANANIQELSVRESIVEFLDRPFLNTSKYFEFEHVPIGEVTKLLIKPKCNVRSYIWQDTYLKKDPTLNKSIFMVKFLAMSFMKQFLQEILKILQNVGYNIDYCDLHSREGSKSQTANSQINYFEKYDLDSPEKAQNVIKTLLHYHWANIVRTIEATASDNNWCILETFSHLDQLPGLQDIKVWMKEISDFMGLSLTVSKFFFSIDQSMELAKSVHGLSGQGKCSQDSN
jgi:hypothetical protein